MRWAISLRKFWRNSEGRVCSRSRISRKHWKMCGLPFLKQMLILRSSKSSSIASVKRPWARKSCRVWLQDIRSSKSSGMSSRRWWGMSGRDLPWAPRLRPSWWWLDYKEPERPRPAASLRVCLRIKASECCWLPQTRVVPRPVSNWVPLVGISGWKFTVRITFRLLKRMWYVSAARG